MTRKEKNSVAQLPVQFKHLRFADIESGKIQAHGGYTLAYRCQQHPAEVPGTVRIEVSYAFAECSLMDNFNKKQGRSIAAGRLNGKAPEHFDSFDITETLPADYMNAVINLGNGLIDIHSDTFDIVAAVCRQFLENFAGVLNLGHPEYEDCSLLENLTVIGERRSLVIDASVLDFEPPTVEELTYQAHVTISETCENLLEKMENFNLEDSPSTNAATLEEIRQGIKSIRDLADAMNEEEDEEGGIEEGIDEESDEGDDDFNGDDEAEELDTEEDDGGPISDSEEREEDESEDDLDQGDDNPR